MQVAPKKEAVAANTAHHERLIQGVEMLACHLSRTFVILLAVAASGYGCAADPPAQAASSPSSPGHVTTRAEVIAELQAARANGELDNPAASYNPQFKWARPRRAPSP
jgi:hypothetical protein